MKYDYLLKRLKPLFFDNVGDLVLGGANGLYRLSKDRQLELLAVLPVSVKNKLLACSTWGYRLARLGFGCGAFFKGLYFFTFGAKLYSYDPLSAKLRCEFNFRVGRGPLSLTVIEDMAGFDDGIFFGEYFGNRNRESVNVYKRTNAESWEIVYTFRQGEINHIHGLVADPIRECVWLLAGDFEHSASIWKAERNFSIVEPLLRGEQAYRACVAFPLEQGLLYATDTQLSGNSIRLLKQLEGEWVSEKILDINGSCIYGGELSEYFVFSTTTEPSDDISNKFLSLFDRKPGPGILKNKSDVLLLRKSDLACRVLFSKNKDFLPYRLFQFGAIIFPHGRSTENTLFAYSVGNKGNDLCTEVYRLDLNLF